MKNDRNLVMLSSPKIDFESFIEYGPEGRVSTRGDIYSYGIMLLEMITRKKPMDEIFTYRRNEFEAMDSYSNSQPNEIY